MTRTTIGNEEIKTAIPVPEASIIFASNVHAGRRVGWHHFPKAVSLSLLTKKLLASTLTNVENISYEF